MSSGIWHIAIKKNSNSTFSEFSQNKSIKIRYANWALQWKSNQSLRYKGLTAILQAAAPVFLNADHIYIVLKKMKNKKCSRENNIELWTISRFKRIDVTNWRVSTKKTVQRKNKSSAWMERDNCKNFLNDRIYWIKEIL